MKVRVVLFVLFAAGYVAAWPQQQIVGGFETTISTYPYLAGLLRSFGGNYFTQECAGTIINTRSVLTAAHCMTRTTTGDSASVLPIPTVEGEVYKVSSIIIYAYFNPNTYDSDIAVMRSSSYFDYGPNVLPAAVAGPNHELADGEAVWAVGWGGTKEGEGSSEILQNVLLWQVDYRTCKERYAELFTSVTENMLCAGDLDVGGRGQCFGDDGGPLFQSSRVLVGIYSFARGCGRARYPNVNTKVSQFSAWISSNA